MSLCQQWLYALKMENSWWFLRCVCMLASPWACICACVRVYTYMCNEPWAWNHTILNGSILGLVTSDPSQSEPSNPPTGLILWCVPVGVLDGICGVSESKTMITVGFSSSQSGKHCISIYSLFLAHIKIKSYCIGHIHIFSITIGYWVKIIMPGCRAHRS